MSPTNFHDHQPRINNIMHPPPLKVNKHSHMIKKSSSPSSSSPPSSSSSSASSLGIAGSAKPPQCQPVIIYTHSPKIIHTNPKDFMALVQKLTGLSRSEDDPIPQVKHENGNRVLAKEESKNVKIVGNDDNESSSAITDENCGSIGDGQVNSCFMPPIFQPLNPNYITNIPIFTPNSAEFLRANQSFYNYTDPLFFPSPNMRNSISTTSALEVKNEFCGY